MISSLLRLLNKLPRRWNFVAAVVLLVLVIAVGVYLFGQIQSCGYHKGRAEYQKESDDWKIERTRLIASAEAKEKRIAELEPQVAIYKDAAEKGKKLDDAKQQQIEDVTKREAENEATANLPSDCRSRATRLCDLFRASDKRFDCKLFFDECGGQ